MSEYRKSLRHLRPATNATSAQNPLGDAPFGVDPDWRERIELAKQAYEEGKRRREGKPITFRMSRPLVPGYGQIRNV